MKEILTDNTALLFVEQFRVSKILSLLLGLHFYFQLCTPLR